MKKRIGLYLTVWTVLLALFNVIAFFFGTWPGSEKYTPSFWIGYGFITATLIGQLICACISFKPTALKKTFYRISVIRIGYIALIVSVIAGGLCMILPFLPYQVGVIVCAAVLAANILSVVKATATVDAVEHIDAKTEANTLFIKSFSAEAEALAANAKSEAVRTECRKVYEAIRYSDPMSCAALSDVERQISLKFSELSEAVKADDLQKVVELAQDVVRFTNDRNQKCKLLK